MDHWFMKLQSSSVIIIADHTAPFHHLRDFSRKFVIQNVIEEQTIYFFLHPLFPFSKAHFGYLSFNDKRWRRTPKKRNFMVDPHEVTKRIVLKKGSRVLVVHQTSKNKFYMSPSCLFFYIPKHCVCAYIKITSALNF